jgi:hypothetical protein
MNKLITLIFALALTGTAMADNLNQPVAHVTLGWDTDNPNILCVVTLPVMHTELFLKDEQQFCVDAQRVHIYVNKVSNGTEAQINYHFDKYHSRPYADFITIFVQTGAERKEYLKRIKDWEAHVYYARKVMLVTPLSARGGK